jgi:3-oxoacyl-[acyl-carrier protein] reductase
LSPRAAVVTGASRGIGRAAAVALAARGLDIALLSRARKDLDETAREVAAHGRRALTIECSVASEEDVTRAAKVVLGELGTPDIVVNNAGIVRRARIHEQSVKDFREVIDVNLLGTFLVTRAFLGSMLELGRGRFIQVSSISATLGTAGAAAYCASKWAVVGFTKSLAEELRSTGLCAMTVLPGSVDTAMLEGSGFSAQITPDEVAQLIAYAALDASPAMNGSAIEMFGP